MDRKESIALFSSYMKLCGVPSLDRHNFRIAELIGKRLGIINGSAWITLWSYYFGRAILPGVQLINCGNEAVQLNFMRAHKEAEECPPEKNIVTFERYAKQLVELHSVDAILLTCSTMNRAVTRVREVIKPFKIPVVQIDEPMMEQAVDLGDKILVIATHGPTVTSTQTLLHETARKSGKSIQCYGRTIEAAFELLGQGRIEQHNRLIADTIREVQNQEHIDTIVLAQLSMSVFLLTYPNPQNDFGVRVLTSGSAGFKKIYSLFTGKEDHPTSTYNAIGSWNLKHPD